VKGWGGEDGERWGGEGENGGRLRVRGEQREIMGAKGGGRRLRGEDMLVEGGRGHKGVEGESMVGWGIREVGQGGGGVGGGLGG